jgi:hypothetical protein
MNVSVEDRVALAGRESKSGAESRKRYSEDSYQSARIREIDRRDAAFAE